MKRVTIALFIVVSAAISLAAQNQINKPERPVEWYLKHYPFIQYKGVIYTFENQFDWPGGFARVDSSGLTPFQFWVSNLPIWSRQRAVGSMKHGTVIAKDSISRVVHLPWRTLNFDDKIIPIHLMADYLFVNGRDDELAAITFSGDTVTFGRFLSGTVSYGPKQEIRWVPGSRRAPTEEEYDKYVSLIATNTNYRSLLSNAEPIAESEVLPGDFYINCDTLGAKGRVVINLVTVENANGHRLYIFGTGCPDECDFYIPLFNNRRDYPWTTTEELARLLGPSMGISGFYRMKLPVVKH